MVAQKRSCQGSERTDIEKIGGNYLIAGYEFVCQGDGGGLRGRSLGGRLADGRGGLGDGR